MDFLDDRIRKLKPYVVPSVGEGEIKLDAQENPYSVHPEVRKKINNVLNGIKLNRYPDPGYRKLRKLIAGYCSVTPGNILVGNGSDELILTTLTACGGPGKIVCSPVPTFAMYEILSELTGTKFIGVPLNEDFKLPVGKILSINPDIVFIAYPNNPTGNCFSRQKIRRIIEHSRGLVVIDEAYYEFSGKTFVSEIKKYPNLLILRTFSKAFSLAGIRAGYVIGNAELIKELRKVQLPYNLSIVNQKILEVILKERQKVLITVKKLLDSRKRMFNELSKLNGVTLFSSEANFILMKIKNIDKILKALKAKKINVRKFGSSDLKGYLRVTIGTEQENKSFIDTIVSSETLSGS